MHGTSSVVGGGVVQPLRAAESKGRQWKHVIFCAQEILNYWDKIKRNWTVFLKFAISVRGGHCLYSLRTSKNTATPRNGNVFLLPPHIFMEQSLYKTQEHIYRHFQCLYSKLSYLYSNSWEHTELNDRVTSECSIGMDVEESGCDNFWCCPTASWRNWGELRESQPGQNSGPSKLVLYKKRTIP